MSCVTVTCYVDQAVQAEDFISAKFPCKVNGIFFQQHQEYNCQFKKRICEAKAAFMLILRRQNQRFETLIQNADPKRPSREYCSCFPREVDDFVSMHCALFEAIVRAQVNRKGVYMTSFKRGYM